MASFKSIFFNERMNPGTLPGLSPAERNLRFLLCGFFVFCSTVLYWYMYDKPVIGIDDANIYMVYMRNLVQGHGFVYMPGGERVEGFTSMLWTLIGAGCYALTGGFGMLFILNFVLVTVSLYRVIRFLDFFSSWKNLVIPPAFFLCLSIFVIPGFFEWNILSLMETGLLGFLLTGLFLDIAAEFINEEHTRTSSTVISIQLFLLILTRPEGIAYALAFIAIRAWLFVQREMEFRKLITENLLPLVVTFAAFTGLLIFRLAYFGNPFPNTYYAKVSTDRIYNLQNGIEYFFSSVIYNPLITFFPVFLLIGLMTFNQKVKYFLGLRSKEQQLLFALLGFCFALIFIPVISGGDFFKMLRFYQPGMLLYMCIPAIFLGWILRKLHVKIVSSFVVAGMLSVPVLLAPKTNLYLSYPVLFAKPSRLLPIFGEFYIATLGREYGNNLNDLFRGCGKLPSAGIYQAGGIAWTYKGECIDLLGLNNTVMAHADPEKKGFRNHASFDKKTFYKFMPDLFMYEPHFLKNINELKSIKPTDAHREEFHFKAFKGIIEDEEFKQKYRHVLFLRDGYLFQTFASIQFLQTLDPKVITVKEIE